MMHIERLFAMAAVCTALAACGGHSDSSTPEVPVTDAVPAEASSSVAGLFKYLTALVASAADDKEPVDLSTFTPQSADDTEPEVLL